MKHYKIIVAYDGTHYAGWQIQPNALSIVQALQDSFFGLFNRKIKLLGASRTDAGVHAQGQVAAFSTDIQISSQRLLSVWNRCLPQDILIRHLEMCEPHFNPRFQVKQKIYHYNFFIERPHPFHARYGTYYPYSLDLEKFRKCLALFVGTHDFRSFCTGDYSNTIRTIDSITMQFDEICKAYKIKIYGKSFLRYMIRRIIGASFKIASSDLPLEYIQHVFHQKNPMQSLPTAPAQGLILTSITY